MTDNAPQIWQNAQTAALDKRSRYLRNLVLDALEGGNRGHIGSSMSLIEILRVLYDSVAKHSADQPGWPERDRIILSKGHGCLAQYAVLADAGYFPNELMKSFCKKDSILGGHPERGKVPGIEASTGALGHGLSLGVGMCLAARIKRCSWHVYVVMGDGEINEGSVWEAAMSAAQHRLGQLTAIVDYNKLQSFGPNREIIDLEPLLDKWKSFGFDTVEVNGHDVADLAAVLGRPADPEGKPRAVIAHTVKGKGISFAENRPEWHHKSNFEPKDLAQMREAVAHA